MSWLHMRKSPLSRQRERERERQGEVEAADGGATGGGTETANRKQKAVSIAVTNKLTGHLCLPPLSVSLHLSLHLYLLPLPASSLGLLSLLSRACSPSLALLLALALAAYQFTLQPGQKLQVPFGITRPSIPCAVFAYQFHDASCPPLHFTPALAHLFPRLRSHAV